MSPVTVDEMNRSTCINYGKPQRYAIVEIDVETQRQKDKWIYFIQAETGEIKIGVTTMPKDKLRSIQTYCPYKVKMLARIKEKGFMKEREVHRQFKYLRIHGEWFKPSNELLEFIKNIKSE